MLESGVSGWPEIMRILKASGKILQDTLNGDADSIAEGLDKAHSCVIEKIEK